MSEADSGSPKACVEVEDLSSADKTPVLVTDADIVPLDGSQPASNEKDETAEDKPKIVEANELSPVISVEGAAIPHNTSIPEETESLSPKDEEVISIPVITTETTCATISEQEREKECPLSVPTSPKNEGEEPKDPEIEETKNDATKQEDSFKEESIVVVATDLNQSSSASFCNDLVNSTSDTVEQETEEQAEDDDNDQIGSETDEGTCSRSRPYVRRPNKSNLNEIISINSTLSSRVMPTPPEEGGEEDDTDSTFINKISHLTPAIPPVINLVVKGEKVAVNPLESSKTEQYAFSLNRPNTNITTSASGISTNSNYNSDKTNSQVTTTPHSTRSRDQSGKSVDEKCGLGSDSSSTLNETSTVVVVDPGTNPVPSKTQPSSNSSTDGCDDPDKLTHPPHLPSHPDHKDKRLLVSLSPATAKSGSGQYQSQHHGTTAASTITSTSGGKKGSKIPIGIAVAWQRLVTSNSSLANSSSLVNTISSSPNKFVAAEMPKQHTQHVEKVGAGSHKAPIRPSSASPSHGVNLHGRDSSSAHKLKEDSSSHKGGSYSVKRGSCGSMSVGGPSVGLSAKRALLETSGKSVTPELMGNVGGGASSRPLPSSSVPPNLGLSYSFHPQQLSSTSPSLLEYHYSNTMRSLTPFPHQTSQHSHFHSLPPTWQAAAAVANQRHIGLGLGSDLSVPQGYPSTGAYIQQTMQNQLQFQQHLAQQYLNYSTGGGSSSISSSHHPHYPSSTASGGYESTLRHHYEVLLQQQQQSEYLRHFHHQQQQQQQQQHQQNHLGHQLLAAAGMYNAMNEGLRTTPTTFPPNTNTRIPLLSPSPNGGVRTPTPNSGFSNSSSAHGLNLSNLSGISPAGQSSSVSTAGAGGYSAGNWPAELFIHQHSSAALSPKSLTSSSPSPVTVQQLHLHPEQGILNTVARGGGNNTTTTTTTFVGGRKCATPSPKLRKSFPLKDVREDKAESATASLCKSQVKKKHLSTSWDKGLDEKKGPETDGENSEIRRRNRHLNLHTSPASSSPGSEYESKTSASQFKPDTERRKDFPLNHGSEKRGDEKEDGHQHILEVSHPPPLLHTTPKLVGPTHTKHDFKRLDSLIERRDSSTEEGRESDTSVPISVGGSAVDKNLVVKSDAMKSSFNKSVMNEAEKGVKCEVVKVETFSASADVSSSKIMDLKERVSIFTPEPLVPPPPLSQLKEQGETDLNQNLKLVSPSHPPTTRVIPHPPPVIKLSLTKKATKVKPAKVDAKLNKKKEEAVNKKPRKITKEKSLLPPNENQTKEKAPPKSKKLNKKEPIPQAILPGKSCSVKATKRKPCKIKPDINVKSKYNSSNNSNEEPLELVKHPKPKVYKSKKTKEQEETSRRLSSSASSSTSCDPLRLDVKGMSKGNGNNVPELNLPVAATSEKAVTIRKIDDSFNSDNNDTKSKDTGTNIGLSLLLPVTKVDGVGTRGSIDAKESKPKKKRPSRVKEISNKLPTPRRSGVLKREKVKKVKVEKVATKKEPRRKPVAIKSKGTEPTFTTASSSSTSTAATTTVILTAPNHPSIAFPTSNCTPSSGGGGQITGFSPMVTISSPNSGCNSGENPSSSVVQSSSMIPISLPYHNSPVTLILPRILPQPPTITNSHQQTSFKLVVSSQEIKIPAFVPNQSGGGLHATTIEGTSQLQTFQLHSHHQEQKMQNFEQNVTSSPLSIYQNVRSSTSSSVLLTTNGGPTANLCDSDNLVGTSSKSSTGIGENTITFIRDSPMSHPTQNGHFIEGLTRQLPVQPLKSCYLSPPATTTSQSVIFRKDFIQSEDNHLNLLATVAQEFGSRDDLGKLAHSNSSRGSSLMTSPILSVQSPELNFLTPSSTVSSCASTSISLPSSPLNTKFNCKSPHRDEYEYDEKEVGSCGAAISSPPGSYKHSVWLKIPTIVPTAGNNTGVTKKRRSPQKKLAKTEKTDGDKSPKKKQKTNKKSELTRANENTQKVEPKHQSTKIKSESSSKLKIPKPKKEKALSPNKKKPQSCKEGLTNTLVKQEHSPPNPTSIDQNHPFRIKMTLPVPKVEKIRIKLSDPANPTLMDKNLQQSSSFNNKKLLTNGDSLQQKINRRHSDGGDKLNKLGKKKLANYGSSSKEIKTIAFPPNTTRKSNDDKNDPLKHKKNSPKNYNDHDNNNHSLSPPEQRTKGKNKVISVNTTTSLLSPASSDSIKERKKPSSASSLTIGDLFLSSFSSLTPPPTAKSVGGGGGGLGPNLLSSHSGTSSIFSPSNFEADKNPQQTQKLMSTMIPTSLAVTGESTENGVTKTKLNWVSDPTFAASAIRGGMASSTCDGDNEVIKKEKVLPPPFAGMSSDEDEDQALMEYERRTAERMRNDGKSGMFGTLSLGEHNKSPLKGFVPYHKRRTNHRSQQQSSHQIKIKPCLKAEPRPRSAASEEEHENSDAEIDFEVASLTNSIPRSHSSMLQQYRNNSGKVNEATCSADSGTRGEPKSIRTLNRNNTSQNHHDHNKRRLSSGTNQQTHATTTSSNRTHKPIIGRRLSLNLETGRTHAIDDDDSEESDEELLDIGGDYSTLHNHHSHRHSSTNQHRHRRQSNATIPKNEKLQRQQSRNGISSTKHRRFSGGSASTSASFGSTLPKKSPQKRGTRSLTTSSRSSISSVVFGGSVRVSRSSRSGGRRESTTTNNTGTIVTDVHMEETLLPGKIELVSVEELKDEMRILTEIQGLFYTGKLKDLQPPDVYGVTLDNERGAPPHLIFSAEEVLEKCVREKKPQTLTVGLRICAYWSPQYSGLYSGRVSTDFNPAGFVPERDLIPIEFDDGDTGMIKLAEIRLLPANHPTREYDPNPLLTLEKKHRKRRHSSTNTTSGVCTGDHDEPDCGESYCAKIAKLDDEEAAEDGDDDDDDEEEEERRKTSQRSYGKSLYWTWTGLGYKRSKAKKSRNKEFFRGIQRGDEIINVGDSAIFISHGNERPYIGRIEKFWEKKGQKIVNVRWFYHPEEVKSPKRVPHLKHTGALFESPHIDENDVQTIAKKCDVVAYTEFKERIGRLPIPKLSMKNSNTSTKPKDLYYVAGFYDPYTYNLQVKI